MAKRSNVDERIDAIARVRRGGVLNPETLELLRAGLKDAQGVIVERAAVTAQELKAKDLIPEIAVAFDRFLEDSSKDKSCVTLTALADALQMLGAAEETLYLRGIKVKRVQHPGPSDVAIGVRCACAMGLAVMGYRDALWEIAAFLHDGEARCRAVAALALGVIGSSAAVPLLHYKITAGDRDPDVMSECFKSLLALDPSHGVPLVAAHLKSDNDSLVEAAALALGESRRPQALELLKTAFAHGVSSSSRRVLLLSIGLLRQEAAVEFLIGVLSSDARAAADAIRALAIYRRDETVRARVSGAVDRGNDPAIKKVFEAEFL